MLRPYKNSHFVFMRPPVPYWFRRLNIPLCCPKQTFSGFVPPEASSTKIVPAGLLSSTWIALLSSCSASGVVRRHNFAFGSKIILLNWHLEGKKKKTTTIPLSFVKSIHWSLRLWVKTHLWALLMALGVIDTTTNTTLLLDPRQFCWIGTWREKKSHFEMLIQSTEAWG